MPLPSLSSLSTPEFSALKRWSDSIETRLSDIEILLQRMSAQISTLGVGSQRDESNPAAYHSITAHTTLTSFDMNRTIYANAGSAYNLTLPQPAEGMNARIVSVGAGTITVKNQSATTIVALPQDTYADFIVMTNSSGSPQWVTGVPVTSRSGKITTTGSIVVDSTSTGITFLDSSGHYWLFTVNTEGALVASDQGTVVPPL